MVGSLETRGRGGLTARQADLVVARVPSPAEATQPVGQLRPCAIRRQRKRQARNV